MCRGLWLSSKRTRQTEPSLRAARRIGALVERAPRSDWPPAELEGSHALLDRELAPVCADHPQDCSIDESDPPAAGLEVVP